MFKKAIFLFFIAVLIIVLGGVGGVLFDAVVMPRVADMPALSGAEFLKHLNERVTVINKTEQIVMREEDPLEKTVSQPAAAVMTLVTSDDTARLSEAGTGVLVTNDGLFMTYGGVQAEGMAARTYQAVLFDGSVRQAELVGHDALTGISFFRLAGSPNTPAIAFANSDDARIGTRVVALGSSDGEYRVRAASGVIGDLDRTFSLSGKTVAFSERWQGVFRPDIAGLERFVGGPLVDANGEMQGMVASLPFDGEKEVFVIPSNAVRESLGRAIAGTLGKRIALGAYYLPVTKGLAAGEGLSRDQGALVYSASGRTGLALIADSRAMRAGFQAGDIIISVDGRPVTLADPLPELLASHVPGDTVEFVLVRDGEERSVQVGF